MRAIKKETGEINGASVGGTFEHYISFRRPPLSRRPMEETMKARRGIPNYVPGISQGSAVAGAIRRKTGSRCSAPEAFSRSHERALSGKLELELGCPWGVRGRQRCQRQSTATVGKPAKLSREHELKTL